MISVLGCLVTAMTCTAALLNWLDPAQPSGALALSPAEIDRQVWQAVSDIDVTPRQSWQRVLVERDGSSAQGATLAAVADRVPCHFRIERSGMLRVNRSWSAQESIGAAPDAVYVVAATGNDDSDLTPAQRTCVERLATAVSQHVAHSPSPLPVAGLIPAS